MRLLKIVLSYSYELCLLDKNRYQKLWEAQCVEFKHEQTNMKGKKKEKL